MDRYESLTPDDILDLKGPTQEFLCPLSANTYGIEFLSFIIQDYVSKKHIFEVSRDRPPQMDLDLANFDENSLRKIKYSFSEDVLRLPSIKTELIFSVGEKQVPNFRMIERHYFRNQLIKSYDFNFGFCIPGSTNTWGAVYDVPPLDEGLVQQMIDNPHETTSDSFYFVGDKLIMHNKASYKYILEDRAQEKRSYDYLNPDKMSAKDAKGAKGSKFQPDDVAEEKGAKGEGGGSKAASKLDDEVWSKESDYY